MTASEILLLLGTANVKCKGMVPLRHGIWACLRHREQLVAAAEQEGVAAHAGMVGLLDCAESEFGADRKSWL